MNDRIYLIGCALAGTSASKASLRYTEKEIGQRVVRLADAALAAAGEQNDCCKRAVADIVARADNVEAEMRDMIRERDAEIARLSGELDAAQRAINRLSPSCAALLARAEKAEAEVTRLKQPLTQTEVVHVIGRVGLADKLTFAEFYDLDAAITDVKNGRA